MLISAIAAMSRNRVIGKDNQIPWHLPGDLNFFKQTTLGHHVLMGRKNYESMGKPLPKRTNVVITRNPYFISTGCLIAHSIGEALQIARDHGEEEAFVIGGGEIYAQALPFIQRIYLTTIDIEVEGDVFFPRLDRSQWKVVEKREYTADERDPYDYVIEILEREA